MMDDMMTIKVVQPDIFERGGALLDEVAHSGDRLNAAIHGFALGFERRDLIECLAQLQQIYGHLSQLSLMAAVLSIQIKRENDGGPRR